MTVPAERQHFNLRVEELGKERTAKDERNREIDADIAASNDQIALCKTRIGGAGGETEGILRGTGRTADETGAGIPEYP